MIDVTSRQKRYFALAKTNAEKSTYRRSSSRIIKVSIGAVIVKGNYVVSEGTNQCKTHPFQHKHNCITHYIAPSPKIHAEMDALIRSRYVDLTGCEIFVYRKMVDGSLGNCRPCKACLNAIRYAGIKHIYYTTENGFDYERINK